MKKFIKFLIAALVALIFIVVITAITLPFIIDPNDYKPQITQLVKEKTGRTLTIPGDIELSVFPWLGVKLGKVELSNAKGFGKQAFAKIDAVDVRVELLPLLQKQVHIGHVQLNGLELDLQRNKQGFTNWDDLIKKQAPTKVTTEKLAPSSEPALAITSLAVGGISIKNAKASWQDHQANQYIQIKELNLTSGAINEGEPISLELTTQIDSNAPDVKGNLKLITTALLDQNKNLLRLDNTQLATKLSGKTLPASKLDATLGSDKILFNQKQQSLDLQGLTLVAFGLQLHSDIKATGLDKSPRYQISLASDVFSLKEIAKQLAIEMPETADAKALRKIQLSTKLIGDTNNVTLKPLTLKLDDSNINGYLQVNNFAKPAISYQLSVDGINADRYLPPATKNEQNGKKTAAPASAATSQALQLPTELLRSLDIKGDVKVGQLQMTNLRSEQIQLGTNAKDGVIRLYPVKADMYQGNYSGDIKLDVRGKSPYMAMNERLTNINIGPMLKDMLGKDNVHGTANINAKLTARGTTPESIRRTLNGTAGFEFKDGFLKGIDIYFYKKKLEALKNNKPAPKPDKDAKTEFAKLKGTINVKNGVAQNNDLSATIPLARIIGKGSVNLVKETVDYTAYAKFTSSAKVHDGETYAQISKPALPIHIKGSLTQPKISIDFQSVIKAEAKKRLDEKKAAAKRKLDAKRQQKEQDAKDKLKQKLDDKLKDLLNR